MMVNQNYALGLVLLFQKRSSFTQLKHNTQAEFFSSGPFVICNPVGLCIKLEVHVQNFVCVHCINLTNCCVFHRRQRGRLKLCSKSVLFDPKDTKYPILKVMSCIPGWNLLPFGINDLIKSHIIKFHM